jgi:RsiW-degrading membrane proteinase PrsW (M82 family)
MSIVVSCSCGKRLRARDELAGKRAKCPGCGKALLVPPTAADPEQDLYDVVDAPTPVPSMPKPVAPPRPPIAAAPAYSPPVAGRAAPIAKKPVAAPALAQESGPQMRQYLYWILVVTLIPLAWSTFHRVSHDVESRLNKTISAHPELAQKIESLGEDASSDELFKFFPGHRIDGALLARDSWGHWFFAFLSGAAFFGLILLIFPRGTVDLRRLLIVGTFTATIGILFLLAVQWIADWTQGRIMYGRSILVIFFYIAKFIGYSYRAALDPETNFFVSCFGFTFGVGLCEEIVKALPLLVHYRDHQTSFLSWRAACLVGLISGVGFGVSEGITYSSDFYNGVVGGETYLVRFVSCVALHAAWSGAAGIFIYKHQNLLQGAESIWGVMGDAVALVSVPMVLHGLYDTLLKKDYHVLALLTAVASFVWLAWQIESARRVFDEQESPRPRRAFAAA